MEREVIIEKLTEIICNRLGLDAEEVTMDGNIREDFGADSLDMVDLVMDVEDEFGVEIPEDSMDTMIIVKDVVDFIEANI